MKRRVVSANPRVFLIFLFFFFLVSERSFVAAEENPINIETTANGFLFNTENLKPGDWIPREITISNEGDQDFRYIAKVGESRSIKGLFEELELLVKFEETLLYDGKLQDFTGFDPRELVEGASETLFFEVTMPSHLGNEFQGSYAEVEIIFLAEGTEPTPVPEETDESTGPSPDDSIKPVIVPKLPNTSTNYFNWLWLGIGTVVVGSIALIYTQIKSRKDYN